MLLLLLLLGSAIANDSSKHGNYTITRISSCPGEGYFFSQGIGLNEVEPSQCQLCFCKSDGFAVCWERNRPQCKGKNHVIEDLSNSRLRRSSTGVANLPTNTSGSAISLVYRKQAAHACKPVGSSLSKGCPPDDWCLGCTLCDCDITGRWNCHILSFCSDKKAPKVIESHNDTLKRLPVQVMPKANLNTNTHKVHRYVKRLHTSLKCNKSARSIDSDHNCTMSDLAIGDRRRDDTTIVIGRDLVGRTPMEVQGVRVKKVIHDNTGSIKLAHKIVQRAMAAVHKIINMNERNSTNVTKLFKVVQKRSMSLGDSKTTQADYMSPHMYKKTSPRKYRKKVPVNKLIAENRLDRKMRYKRDISFLYKGVTTQKIPTASSNNSKKPLNEASRTRSMELNEYEYYRYNVLTAKNSNNETDRSIRKIDDHANSSKTNLNNPMDSVKGQIILPLNYNRKSDLNLNIRQTENTPNKIIMNSSNLINNNENIQSDTEFTNIVDIVLNRKRIYLQDLLKKSSYHKNMAKKFNIITYLNSLLSQIFQNDGQLSEDNLRGLLKKQNFIDIFCNQNVTCKVRPKDEIKLQIKINDVNGEMYKIIGIMRLMKKILMDIELNDKYNQICEKFSPANVQQPNGVPSKEKKVKTITFGDKKKILLYFLKDSYNTFIKAIENCSNILYDILNILTGKNLFKRSNYRYFFGAKPNAPRKNNLKIMTSEEKFKKLKTVLLNYNVLQNQFIKIIYDMLSKLESNLPSNNLASEKYFKKDFNNIQAMETYTKNIIENLRKIKNLAQKLSTTRRVKRSTMRDDDAVEYLLMLMEYLLKQNYPLDAAPVNDGIDLLIDAIKHAPDIKPIKKKVLDYPVTRTPTTRTTPKVTAETYSYVDNIYGIDSLEKGINDSSRSEDNQVFSPIIDGDDKAEDIRKLLHESKKIGNKFQFSNLNNIRKNHQFDPIITTTPPIIPTTPLIRYDFYKENIAEQSDMEKSLKIDNHFNVFDKDLKSENNRIDHNKKEETEEYSAPSPLTPITEMDLSFPITLPTRTSPEITTRKFHHIAKDKFEDPDSVTYKRHKSKSRFGWIDYDQEESGSKLVQRESATKSSTTNSPKAQTDINDISSISKEVIEYDNNKRFNKLLPSAMFVKYNMMNDDANKKSEMDSESKELEQEDTYVNDIFPSYLT